MDLKDTDLPFKIPDLEDGYPDGRVKSGVPQTSFKVAGVFFPVRSMV